MCYGNLYQPTPKENPVYHSIDDVIRAVLSILPDAEVSHDNDGQIVVYTGLTLEADDVAGGEMNTPLNPARPEAVRLVVLNDGETFTDALGVAVMDWYGENEIEAIEDALAAHSTPEDDPDLVLVGFFNEAGVIA